MLVDFGMEFGVDFDVDFGLKFGTLVVLYSSGQGR